MKMPKRIFIFSTIFFLIAFGLLFCLEAAAESRYFEYDSQTINGVTARKLPNAYDNDGFNSWLTRSRSTLVKSWWGIKVYKVNTGGGKTLISGANPVAQVNRSTTTGAGRSFLFGQWDLGTISSQDRDLDPNDAIFIEVWHKWDDEPGWTKIGEFITERLGADYLNNVIWTVTYEIRIRLVSDYNYEFRYGNIETWIEDTPEYSPTSYIGNFAWTPPVPTGVTISGSTNSANCTGCVKVAVNATRQSQQGNISGGNWSISNVSVASGDIVTVWIDGAVESSESTGVTRYNSGDIPEMVLDTNTLSIGSNQNQGLFVGYLSLYDADHGNDGGDEDIVYSANGGVLNAIDRVINILSGDTLTVGGTETLTTRDLSINGTLTSGGSGTFNISGAWNNASVFNSATETVNFTSTGAQTMDFQGTSDDNSDIYNVVFSGSGSWILTTPLIVRNQLTVAAGNVTVNGSQNVTVGTGASNGSIVCGATSCGTIDFSSGTTILKGAGDFGTAGLNLNWAFYNLTFGDGTNTKTTTFRGTGTVNIGRTLTISTNHTLDIIGDSTIAVNYIASSATNIAVATYYNLGVGTKADAIAVTYSLLGATTVTNTLTIGAGGSGAYDTLSTNNFLLTSTFINVTQWGKLKANNSTIKITGTGTPFNISSLGGQFVSDASQVNYTATGAVTVTLAATTYYNLGVGTDADSYSAAFILGGNTTVSKTLTVGNNASSGIDTLAASSFTLTLSGPGTPFVITSKGSFSAGTSLVKYTSSAAGTSIAAATYNNLEVKPSAAGATYVLGIGTSQTIKTNGYFTIGDGTIGVTVSALTNDPTLSVVGNFTISANATFTASDNPASTFTVSSNWTNSGTFTHSNGSTVIFDDNTKETFIYGETKFYNLQSTAGSKRIYFEEGKTQTIDTGGALTLNGQFCTTMIFLRSTVEDKQWKIKVLGSSTVSYVDVKDSNASGNTISANSSRDSFFNTNWIIDIGACGFSTLTGWAWSENIGWISFNSSNCDVDRDGKYEGADEGGGLTPAPAMCPTSGTAYYYGVEFDYTTNNFFGYAWSDNIGWISFSPSGPYPDYSVTDCAEHSAYLENGWEVKGWARACAGAANADCTGDANPAAGGWDGWICLNDLGIYDAAPPANDYDAILDTVSNEFHGWSWGGGGINATNAVVGWISWNCADRGVCGSLSNYKVVFNPANQKPTASNLNKSIEYCDIAPEVGQLNLKWTYTDFEKTNQQAYSLEVQQKEGFDWQTKVLCENIATSGPSSGKDGTTAVLIKTTPTADVCDSVYNDIGYGKYTRWRVKVKDGDGIWSAWTNWTTEFQIDAHAHPWVEFYSVPSIPAIGDSVDFFSDQSEAYNATKTIASWSWTFEDANPNTSNIQSPTDIYFLTAGPKEIGLTITDSDGLPFQCTHRETLNVTLPLPGWKEISPSF